VTSSSLGLSEVTEPAVLLSQGVSGGGGERLGLPAGGVLGDASASMVKTECLRLPLCSEERPLWRESTVSTTCCAVL